MTTGKNWVFDALNIMLYAKFAGVPQVESTVRVSVRTLDSLATDIHETRIDVLSIDVEGGELCMR